MAEYEYVQRKSDGLYKSVDAGFTADRAKAFVFNEGCASGLFDYLTDEYEFVALDDAEIAEFEARKGEL